MGYKLEKPTNFSHGHILKSCPSQLHTKDFNRSPTDTTVKCADMYSSFLPDVTALGIVSLRGSFPQLFMNQSAQGEGEIRTQYLVDNLRRSYTECFEAHAGYKVT